MSRLPAGSQLVLATHNAGKIREISEMLQSYGMTVRSAGDFELDEPEETEDSFEGNALLKAEYVSKATGLPALADDSGIEVDGLDGAPGVYTADWAETDEGRDYMRAMRRVWKELDERNVSGVRTARFVSTLCLFEPDRQPTFFRGVAEGSLVWPPRGENGFGFDPMFVPKGETDTFGEMDPTKKKSLSHRADAFDKFKAACLA